MRGRFALCTCWSLALMLTLALAIQASAQANKAKDKPKQDRIDGRVRMINKDTSTITVRERRTNAERPVVYNDATKFTFRNKPGSLDDVKDGRRVICLGKFDEKARLIATRVDVRGE